ncbi:Protein N-acetyltransferase, RimJ/RimL family [Roseateles sp. YR242]|uniref:GNAT family N-acetyltransferase n=1 Tax=Roseateles sp. YR242 TaxID=1855305 RepID=UPI0008BA71E0|nr:GNAT family N-acetyltransferase [Roseateles sp. YR242]SEK27343.1 Protein N-acetyltransferase, RimJ/RimL family [Roseateles sp. YR242]
MTQLLTPRLRLVPFEDSHLAGLNALNSDAEVMRYLQGRPETLEETQAGIDRVKAKWKQWGYSWWSFLERDSGELVGAGCIQHLNKDQSQPLEIGWRLRRDRWGQGLASEAARRMARFAFDHLAALELTAVCNPDNQDSAQVMQRLGMKFRGIERWYDTDSTVYVISAAEWQASPASAKAAAEAVPEEAELAAAPEQGRSIEL